jgi:hypothetical protein
MAKDKPTQNKVILNRWVTKLITFLTGSETIIGLISSNELIASAPSAYEGQRLDSLVMMLPRTLISHHGRRRSSQPRMRKVRRLTHVGFFSPLLLVLKFPWVLI